jgi:chromosome partitioning protein
MATNLATVHVLNGYDILLVDADKQASSATWATTRDEAGFHPRVPCIQKFGKALHLELKELEKRYQTSIVDSGGRDSTELRSVMLAADRFFSPLKPSQFDAWTLENPDTVVELAQIINPQLRASVLINQANPNPRISEVNDVQGFIRDFENLRLSTVVIRDQIVFRNVA